MADKRNGRKKKKHALANSEWKQNAPAVIYSYTTDNATMTTAS